MKQKVIKKISLSLFFVFILLFTMPTLQVLADSSGPRYPGTGDFVTAGAGTVAWSNPTRITADDTNYATVDLSHETSHYLRGTNYGFTIPDSATIIGIQVEIGRRAENSSSWSYMRDNIIKLVKGGNPVGNNKALTGTNWPTSITNKDYGGAADLWGTTWTPADINAANFGAVISTTSDSFFGCIATVDYIRIAITYTNVGTNQAPVITSDGGGAAAAVYVAENTTAVTTVTATDDGLPAATLIYSISGGLDAAKFQIDSTSGVLSFITPPIFASPTDNGSNNIYDLTVQVSDTVLTDAQDIAVTVTNVNDAPVITQSDPQTVLMDEDGIPIAFSLTLDATDPDTSPTLTWSISVQALHGTAGASGTGFSKAITYVPTANYNGADLFTVRVADDLGLTDEIVVNVNITPIADIYYVNNLDLDASDSNPGTDPNFPFLTINQGALVARAGDTVHVLDGTYAETVELYTNSGIDGDPITFFADPGVIVSGSGSTASGAAFYVADRSYIVIDGFEVVGTAYRGIFVLDSDHISIKNNIVSAAGQRSDGLRMQGIQFKTVVNSIIDGNTTFDNSSMGIRLTNASNNNVVSNNISYGNYAAVLPEDITDAAGIELDDSDNNIVIHNIVYDNEDSGINFYQLTGDGSNNNQAIGNLAYGNGDHGIDNNNSSGQIIVGNTVHGNFTSGINLEAGSFGANVQNNIVMDNGLNPPETRKPGNIYIDETSVSGTILDFNLYFTSGATQIDWDGVPYSNLAAFKTAVPSREINGLESDPLFVSPAPAATAQAVPIPIVVGDYHLMASSPAIDSANSDAPSQPLTDLDGNPRVDDPVATNTGFGTRLFDDRGVYEWQPLITTNLTTVPITDTYGQTVTLTATLTRASDSSGINNKTINFSLNGVSACNATTDSNGVASCTSTLLADVATYPAGVSVIFNSDGVYAQSTNSAQLIVNAKVLTVTGVTAADRPYDGTTAAVLDTSLAALVGVVGSDDVVLNAGTAVGTFSDPNVADNIMVTVSGLTLDGTKALNYTLTQPTTTANITLKVLTVTGITAANRTYDGTTAAVLDTSLAALVGVVGVEDVTLDANSALGTFSDANVADGITVTVSGLTLIGEDIANYTLTQPTTTANITAKVLTVTGVTAADRPYDGTTAAVLDTNLAALVGVVGSDDVVLNAGTAVGTFSDPNVADNIVVTVSGLTLDGTKALNYTLTQPNTTANITLKVLTVTGITAANRTYDGTTGSVLDTSLVALVGVVGVEDVTLDANSALGTFSDANVADGITVSVSGLTLIGEDIANYTLTQPTTTANITAKHITGSFTAADKVFDGTNTATVLTRSLTGVIGLEDVVLNGGTATFEDANVGVDKIVTLVGATLGGLDMNNYILDSVATTTASITPIVYQIYLPLILR